MGSSKKISKYYDWQKTLSYDALLTFVITARGRGKTYGLRKQCINDFIKNGNTFAEICRHKDEIKNIKNGYFDKLAVNNEFPKWKFKIEGTRMYIAPTHEEIDLETGKKIKDEWEFLGAFYALSEYQNVKKRTHTGLKRVIFDETIIEKLDRYHTYFPNEYDILLNIVDSISREDSNEEKIKTRIYLLSNACDLVNPYFQKFKINELVDFGYSWHMNKQVLIHYENPQDYAIKRQTNTLVGRLSSDDVLQTANQNIFVKHGEEFVNDKPKNAKFKFGIIFKKENYGIWADYQNGYVYIDDKIPNNTICPIFTLYREDNTLNTISAHKASEALNTIKSLYYDGLIRYTSYRIMERFSEILIILGIR